MGKLTVSLELAWNDDDNFWQRDIQNSGWIKRRRNIGYNLRPQRRS